jgi:glycosyltransferase involved in cell wall biosynthesis
MKLVLIINGLNSGGAEKSTIKLCESFIGDGHDLILITVSNQFDFYKLKDSITRINLEDFAKLNKNFGIRIGINRLMHWANRFKSGLKLRRILIKEKPDCIISMSAPVAVLTFIFTRFLDYAQIGSERINPSSKVFSHGIIVDKLRPLIYKRGVILSVQTKGIHNWAKDHWKITSIITPNHISEFPNESELKRYLPIKSRSDEVLTISRDHPQKNLDFLLEAWVFVEKLNPNAHLSLVGPDCSSRVETLGAALGLKNFSVYEKTEHLSSYFSKTKVFVSTSRFEGFPNVILEAISHGIPVVTTPSCDLVEDFAKVGSVLVDYTQSPEQFANTLVRLMENGDQLSDLSRKGLSLSQEYSWDKVSKTWYTAIAAAQEK